MKDSNFYTIYNNFDCKINHERPIITLEKINMLFCQFGLRIDKSEIKYIEDKIFKMYKANEKQTDIKSIIDCISAIQYKQPFFDGNHRTSLLFFKLIMKELVPDFEYQASVDNNFDNFFDIYYYDNDTPEENKIKNIAKYIKKSN